MNINWRSTIFSEYHTMPMFLIIVAAAALSISGFQFLQQLIVIPIVYVIADVAAYKVREKKWIVPKSAFVSSLVLASVIAPASLELLILAPLIAVASKHIIRINGRHIFNPAACSLLVMFLAFNVAPIWWTAVTPLVFIFLIADVQVRRLPLAVPFIAVYLGLSSALAITAGAAPVLLDYTALFFAFVMLIEPKTSAFATKAQILIGVLAAVLVIVFSRAIILPGGIDFFLVPLLITNVLAWPLSAKLG